MRYRLVLGIPTFKRPEMLKKLILSVFQCEIELGLISSLDVLIIDNDIDKTALKTIEVIRAYCPPAIGFHYYNYPEKGLSNVRNKILEEAFKFQPDYILSVDDDEYVPKEWLMKLVKTILKNNADIALGPKIASFEYDVPKSITEWFKSAKHNDQEQLYSFPGTGNVIWRTNFLEENELRFDIRFNSKGGEDIFFGIQSLKRNAKIFWSEEAYVYETIPKARASLKWLLQRRYSVANTYTYIIIIDKNFKLIAKKILMIFLHLLIGVLTLPLLLFNFNFRYYGILKIAESFGGFAGLLNIKYYEYSKPR